jgi:hypothetical protein
MEISPAMGFHSIVRMPVSMEVVEYTAVVVGN